MSNQMKKKLLALAADRRTLADVSNQAGHWYDVLVTPNLQQAMNWLEDQPEIACLVVECSEQMPGGPILLEKARALLPDARRVALSSFDDLRPLIEMLHSGAIQKLIQRPIVPSELWAAIVPVETLPNSAGKLRQAG